MAPHVFTIIPDQIPIFFSHSKIFSICQENSTTVLLKYHRLSTQSCPVCVCVCDGGGLSRDGSLRPAKSATPSWCRADLLRVFTAKHWQHACVQPEQNASLFFFFFFTSTQSGSNLWISCVPETVAVERKRKLIPAEGERHQGEAARLNWPRLTPPCCPIDLGMKNAVNNPHGKRSVITGSRR